MAFAAGLLAALPAAMWYWHVSAAASPQSPLADRVFYSVRQSAAEHSPPHPLLYSADFYRQMLDDLSGVVLTPIGFALAAAGLIHPAWRRYLPWLLGSSILVILLPRKFYEMNYYHMAILPPLAILAGLGWQVFAERVRPSRATVFVLAAIGLAFSLRYAARPAFTTPDEDRAVVSAGRAVQRLTDANEPVVTMHGTSIDLIYYCERPGWAVPPDTPKLADALDEQRRNGARFLVVVGDDAAMDRPAGIARPAIDGKGYRIYRLTPPGRDSSDP
jgi:hypothetical protein